MKMGIVFEEFTVLTLVAFMEVSTGHFASSIRCIVYLENHVVHTCTCGNTPLIQSCRTKM